MMPTSFFQSIKGKLYGNRSGPLLRAADGRDPFAGPPQNISSDSYHGFNPYMDLRSRGRFSSTIDMKVQVQPAQPSPRTTPEGRSPRFTR